MEIRAATTGDLDFFSRLAEVEGWRVPPGELDLYRNELADNAYVLRREEETLGFVSAVDYGRSGWIGNLLVPAEYRRRGYGGLLFGHAVDVLRLRGVADLWLTASHLGRPLYERAGFRSVGRIARWSHRGGGGGGGLTAAPTGENDLIRLDGEVWGEGRDRLLVPLCRLGRTLRCGSTAALLQGGEGLRVLGPWISASGCPRENRQVLSGALEACAPTDELVVDVFTGSACAALPQLAGFTFRGENELMVLGDVGRVELGALVSLASLGSIG